MYDQIIIQRPEAGGGQGAARADAAACIACCVCYGVHFHLHAASPAQLQQMLAMVPHNTVIDTLNHEAQPAEAASFTWPDNEPAADAHASGDSEVLSAAERLRRDLMVHVADHAPHHVFLHAGVVSWRGRGLVLPGPSFAGKTTLVAALVRAGALYYSDEYAVIDPAGLIHPYARSLQMRRPGLAAQAATPIAKLKGHGATEPTAAAVVAFVGFQPSAAWCPQPVSPGMAVLEMLRHAIPVQRTPGRVLASLAALIAPARIVQSARAEAEPTARALLALLEAA